MPGTVGEQDVVIADQRLAVDQFSPPRHVVRVELDDQKVQKRGADVRRRHGADRDGDVVRGDVDE